MQRAARRLALNLLSGALLGALLLGAGGRIVMRLLAISIGHDPVFSIGGSLEVVAYGAIVGSLAGAALMFLAPILPGGRWVAGTLFGLLSYAGTVLTLPAHIAETARPFADRMPLVLALFGLCFLAFGLAMARLSSLWSSPAPADAPAAPRE